jgi:hypothetical protein
MRGNYEQHVAYAEITLRVEDDYSDTIALIDDPRDESSYGSRQSRTRTIINAGLTLARWDSQPPSLLTVSVECSNMKGVWPSHRARPNSAFITAWIQGWGWDLSWILA